MRAALYVIVIPIIFVLSKVATSSNSTFMLSMVVVMDTLACVVIPRGISTVRAEINRDRPGSGRPEVFYQGRVSKLIGNLIVAGVFEIVSFGLLCVVVAEGIVATARLVGYVP